MRMRTRNKFNDIGLGISFSKWDWRLGILSISIHTPFIVFVFSHEFKEMRGR